MLNSFAFILDRRAKIKGFTSVLRLLSRFNDVDYSSYLTEVRTELSETYKKMKLNWFHESAEAYSTSHNQ